MQKFLLGLFALILCTTGIAVSNYTATQGSGTNFNSFDVGGVKAPGMVVTDASTGATDVGAAILSAVQGSIPAGTALIGKVGLQDNSGNAYFADPCQRAAKTYTPITITTATTTRIVAPSASNRTYICNIFLTSAAADNIGIIEGTGGTCGSGTAGVIGGTTAANGPNFAANGGVALGNGGFAIAATAGTNVDLCLITSASTALAGTISWVQAP